MGEKTINAPADRGSVTRLTTDPRRRPRRATPVARAQDARRQLRSRQERFAHLKRMYD